MKLVGEQIQTKAKILFAGTINLYSEESHESEQILKAEVARKVYVQSAKGMFSLANMICIGKTTHLLRMLMRTRFRVDQIQLEKQAKDHKCISKFSKRTSERRLEYRPNRPHKYRAAKAVLKIFLKGKS